MSLLKEQEREMILMQTETRWIQSWPVNFLQSEDEKAN